MKLYLGLIFITQLLVEGSQAIHLSDEECKNILTAIYFVRSMARAVEDVTLISFKERPQIINMFVDMKSDMADIIIDTEVNTIVIPRLLWMVSRFFKEMDETSLENITSSVLKLYTSFGLPKETLKFIAAPLKGILKQSFDGKMPQDEMMNLIKFFDKVVKSIENYSSNK